MSVASLPSRFDLEAPAFGQDQGSRGVFFSCERDIYGSST